MRALNVEPQGEVGAAFADRTHGKAVDVWVVSLDRRGAARRNRVCAGSAAGGVGIRIHAQKFGPDKTPENFAQEGFGEGAGVGGANR